MFKNLTYKKRLLLLIFGFIFFMFIAYKISISSTIELINMCNQTEEKIKLAKNANSKIKLLQNQLQYLNKKIGSNISSEIDFQDLLLDRVSEYCIKNNLIYIDMQKTHKFKKGNYQIETNVFSVEGKFKQLLKLIYNLETKYSGKIASIHFESVKDLKTKQYRLFIHIYYQNIKQL